MGLFGNIFSGSDQGSGSDNGISWITLENEGQLNTLLQDSITTTQVIFKHSTTCGVSRMALNMFTSNYGLQPNQASMYFLDLHAFRQLSNLVADKFSVVHQSPQLIIIRNGEVVFHTSHGAIADADLEAFV